MDIYGCFMLFPKMWDPQNWWFIMGKSYKQIDDLGVSLF
jgi:hypothetical protein